MLQKDANLWGVVNVIDPGEAALGCLTGRRELKAGR
jgi:hypothetical protein